MRREILAAALRAQRSATLDALAAGGWPPGDPGSQRTAAWAARLVAVDRGLVTGRLVAVLRASPTRGAYEASLAAAAEPWRRRPAHELRESLVRWGERSARLARRVPRPVAGFRISGWFGRQPFRYLFVRRVLEEWASLPDGTDEGGPLPPEVGHCLSLGVLAALPAVALPHVEVASGVVRLVVDVVGGEDLAVPTRRGRRGRRPPARLTWSFDFARRHYGPRVTGSPDAVVRLTAERLASLAERGVDWRADPGIALDGDAGLAAALLDGIAGTPGQAGGADGAP